MKTLNSPPKFLLYAILRAVRHLRTPILYFQCKCGCRFSSSMKECPKRGDKVEHSPDPKRESPIPWWGSVAVIVIGIIVCIMAAHCKLPTLDRIGDALVFIPLGNLFGMSLRR